METFNNYKSLNLIVVKTDEYLYYLEKNGISKIKTKELKKQYTIIKQEMYSEYEYKKEALHKINLLISERMGWNYGRIRY